MRPDLIRGNQRHLRRGKNMMTGIEGLALASNTRYFLVLDKYTSIEPSLLKFIIFYFAEELRWTKNETWMASFKPWMPLSITGWSYLSCWLWSKKPRIRWETLIDWPGEEDWLIDKVRKIDLFTGWETLIDWPGEKHWLINQVRKIDWLTGWESWLIDQVRKIDWLTRWERLIDWPGEKDWSIDRVRKIDWLIDRVRNIDWLTRWERLIDWPGEKDWLIDQVRKIDWNFFRTAQVITNQAPRLFSLLLFIPRFEGGNDDEFYSSAWFHPIWYFFNLRTASSFWENLFKSLIQ